MTRCGLGARGVDYVETTRNGTTTVGFPLYDAHGNGVARLYRDGAGWAVSDRSATDAWFQFERKRPTLGRGKAARPRTTAGRNYLGGFGHDDGAGMRVDGE